MSKAEERKWGRGGGREGGRMARGASKVPSSSPDMWYSLTRLLRGVVTLGLLLVAAVVDGPGVVTAQKTDDLGFEARTYNGTNNNLDHPLWGSVNISQVRFLIVLFVHESVPSTRALRLSGEKLRYQLPGWCRLGEAARILEMAPFLPC